MSEYDEQLARELLALTAPDVGYPRIDREFVRAMLADAWQLGRSAGADPAAVNPFLNRDER